MKLHLPKLLTAALLAACTALALNTTAAAASTGTASFTGGSISYDRGDQLLNMYLTKDLTTGQASSTTLTLDNSVNIRGGDFFAGNYTVSIWVTKDSLSSDQLLFAYAGSAPTSNDYGANGIYWNAANSTITIGRGKVTGDYTGMAWKDNQTSGSLADALGENNLVNLTFAVTGGNQSQAATVWVNGVKQDELAAYAGNMNNSTATMNLYVSTAPTYGNISITNQTLTEQTAIYTLMGLSTEKPAEAINYVWTGSTDNVWNTETTNWETKEAPGTPVAFQSGDNNTVTLTADGQRKEISLETAATISKLTAVDSYTLTITEGASLSTGSIVVTGTDKTLSLKNETGSTYNLPTASGTGNIALSEGTFTLSAAPTTAKLLVNGGTLELGDASYTLPTFEISNGGVVTTTRNDGTACVTGDIHILAGGTFKVIGGHDAFGYNGGQTDNIYMTGESGKIAKLELNQNTGNSVTMQTNLHMGGYSSIVSKDGTKGFNTFGCSISAQGEQNTIQLMDLRNNVTIDVAASGSLEIAKVTKNGNGDKVITKTGAGTLSFTGDSLMNGLNVNKGTVAFTGGTSTVDALSLASDGTLSVSGSGTVVNIGGANNTISSTVQVDAATLNLTGTFAIDGIPGDMQTTWSGAADAGNGFKTSTGEIKVYTATNGGAVTIADSGHITYGGTDVKDSLNNGVYSVHGETDYSNFYVNTDGTTELVTKAYSDSHSPDKFTLAANTGLTVDQSVTATVTGSGASSVVTIDSNEVLSGTAQSVTIAGNGTYALTRGTTSLGTNVTLDDTWSGAVRLGGFAFDNDHTHSLTPYWNTKEDSVVEMYGITGGYLEGWNGGQEAANILLTNPEVGEIAWKWSDGTSGNADPNITFTGEWEGDGTFQVSNLRQNFTFSGDITGWHGAFDYHGNHGTTLTFTGDANVINASILNNGVNDASNTQKQFHLVVQNDASFGEDVAAYTLNVASGASATFQGDAAFNSLSGPGKVVLEENSTLTVSGTVASDVTIDAKDGSTIDAELAPTQVGIAADATATFVQGISDADVEFYGEDGVGVQVKNTNEAGGDALRYDITKENAKVMADGLVGASESAVTVKNEVVVKEILNYGGSPLTLTHVDTETLQSVGAYAEGVTLQNVGADPIVLKDITLIGTTVAVYQGGEEIAAQEGKVTIAETLSAGGGTLLANLEMANGSTLDLSLMDGGMQALTLGSEFTIADGSLVTLDDATLAAIAGLENIGDKVILIKQYGDHELTTNLTNGDWARTHFDLSSIAGADYQLYVGETEIGLMKSSNVPEPTTGTLSLLALMALAARRRRK